MSDGIVIAGGGLAAQRAAEAFRRLGHDGPVRMVCAEPHLPYDRPPLSKQVLRGEQTGDSVRFRSDDWYVEHDIDVLLGVGATGLTAAEQRLVLSDGRTLRYEQLLIATGSRPRRLPLLAGYGNVSELRTIDDALRLRGELTSGARLVILGAGFVGLEVASTARKLGAQVTIIEAAPKPLIGVLGDQIGTWFCELHCAEGVQVITDRTVTDVRGQGDVASLELSDGRIVQADHVLVGVGVQPDVEWLADSSLASGGVPVDAHGRTEIAGVFAAGDAAATYDHRVKRHVPGSHWEAAGRQAVRAARVMVGLEPGDVELSSFWTDQYGLRIQYLGNARLADATTIDGEPESRSFTVTYTRAGVPVAALLVDRTRSLPAMRKLISHGGPP
jgi:3-phenylpropionate/trans-cinnamate dioxygenase ferredoxin reductase component